MPTSPPYLSARSSRATRSSALLALVLAPASAAQTPEPPEEVVVPPAEVLEPLHDLLYDSVYDGRIGCLSILVAREGEVLWEQGLGWADAENERPASSDTAYPVASVSKSLTGLAASLLVADGRLDLETPVAEVLTSFRVATGSWVKEPLRVRDLARMTAGMPHGGVYWVRDAPATARAGSQAAVRAFAVVDEEPGRTFRYSNWTSGVLEAVVQDVSGESLEGFLHRRVFEPLGMGATRAAPAAGDLHLARVRSGGHVFDVAPLLTPSGGQGFYSSAKDLARLAAAHLDPERCREQGLDPAALAASRAAPDGGTAGPGGYWMGWGRFSSEGATFELANGQDFDMTSCMLLCPERKAVAICLTNTQWWGAPGGERVADVVARRAMDALVPGRDRAYEEARRRYESGDGRPREAAAGAEIPGEGEWTGTLRLAGTDLDAMLTLDSRSSATLTFGPIVARGQVHASEGRLEGSLLPSGTLDFFGETSALDELSIRLTPFGPDRLCGSALLGIGAPERKTHGSGAALLELSR